MSNVAKITEISAESEISFDDAIKVGIARAAKTIENIEGAWIKEQKLVVKAGTVAAYRVTMKLTFVIRD